MTATWVPFWLSNPTWDPAPVERVGATSNAGTDVQTLIVDTPTNTTAGDTMLAWFGIRGNTSPVTPSGWTKLGEWSSGTGTGNSALALYQLTLTEEPAASYTFDAGASNRWTAIITTYRHVVDVMVGAGDSGIGATPDAPGISPSVDGMLVFGSTVRDVKTSDPSGMSLVIANEASAQETYVWDETISTSPTGDRTFTTGTADDWAAVLVGLLSEEDLGGTDPIFIGKSNNSIDGATSLVLDLPPGVEDGDLLLTVVAHRASESLTTDPSGWDGSWFIGSSGVGSTQISLHSYWRRASSEPSTYTFGFTAGTKAAGGIAVYRNILATGDPIEDYAWVAFDGTEGSTYTLAEITTSSTPTMLVGVLGMRSTTTFTATSPLTERIDHNNGGGASIGLAEELNWGAGLTGTRSFTANANNPAVGLLLALKPEGVGTGDFIGWGIPI